MRRPLLPIITVLVVAAAAWVAYWRAPSTDVGTPPLLPEFVAHVNDVARVEITTRLNKTLLRRNGDRWLIENRDDYPAVFENVKSAILGLSELKILEAKTRKPDLYSRLGVEDVQSEKSASMLIQLKDAKGGNLAAVILGKSREGGDEGPLANSRYVRVQGQEQSFLVKGPLEVSADPMTWVSRDLMDIRGGRVREVTIERPGEPTVTARRDKPEDIELTLQDVPEDHVVRSVSVVTSLSTALEELRLDDVRARRALNWPQQTTTTTLHTFDGLTAVVRVADIDGRKYAAFEFSVEPGAETNPVPETGEESPVIGMEGKPAPANPAKNKPTLTVGQQVADLDAKVKNWAYVLPDYKFDMLTRTKDSLIAEKKKPAPPPPPVKDPLKVEHYDQDGKLIPESPEAPVPVRPSPPR
ncbi:MAG TPA: DUF4340 domain-containing protein [Gammaproteobacteria bacterium]|nr:DUF4340 domain-containing protein [Gammaproteobacteria bacterium]